MKGCLDHGYIGEADGYARVMRQGLRRPAHVWAVLDAGGRINPGQVVMHLCNNPRCVRPAHLVVSSQSANIKQMYSQGRGVDNTGQRNGRAKLTDKQAAEIKNSNQPGVVLSKQYGVSQALISAIRSGTRRST